MKLAPLAYQLNPSQERILEFKGYNKKSVIEDGEMRDMYNLSSDEYPCLSQRKSRGIYETGIPNLTKPTAVIVKNKKLAIISNGKFYYNGTMYPSLALSDKTQMVAINTRICFFPEKLFFNTQTGETGSLNAAAGAENVTLTVTTSSLTFPSSAGLKLSEKFKAGDAVKISAVGKSDLNVSAVIQEVSDNTITFPDETFIFVTADGNTEENVAVQRIAIGRSCPDLDYVMESNNRLWGVSNSDNTIYACKLGDPTNWTYYQNSSLDSYYAEQGTDGEWTGCAAYSTHMLFFKEDYIHKIYGSKPSNYQIETAQCHALEKGSNKSIAIINETVFYKSRLGIMAYAGGVPVLVSDNFGTDRYVDAVAGTDGIKYFVSVLRDGKPELLVYDVEKMMWHKEDDARARDFCYHNGKLLYIDESDNLIYEISSGKPEEDIEWFAELGPFDEFIEDKKVYSKLKMRMKLEVGSSLTVSISIDDNPWEVIENIHSEDDRALLLPIVPRRCNRFAVKLEGIGRCRIESLVREYRLGTGVKDVRL
ncbi:MAG: hypothetical protein Q4C46_05485 [Bacillota bacterium]|nr:hypothetical protein [Bacillota bacterium]